jgi:2'-5' RNA ligase
MLSESLRGITWTRPEQLHLTLRFLGDTPSDIAKRIEEDLAAIRVESFILPIEEVGVFPSNGPPKVLWAGVGSGHPHLFQLRQRLDDTILSAGLDLDVRHFQPHITVARCSGASASGIAAWLRRHGGFSVAPYRVACFDLCSSRLSHLGAEHTLKRRYPLT